MFTAGSRLVQDTAGSEGIQEDFMVDTVRTLSALQTLLADNDTGDITPQEVRDFLVSVRQAEGLGGSQAKARVVSSVASPGGAVTFDETSFNDGDLVTVGSNRFTFSRAATVMVAASIRYATGGSHTLVARLFNSGDTTLSTPVRQQNNGESFSGAAIVEVAAGDYLQLMSFHGTSSNIFSDANGETALAVGELWLT